MSEQPVNDQYVPTAADRFTFGLWTVGNVGRDPFGNETLATRSGRAVQRLAEPAHGVNFHDDDLIPPGSTAAERKSILKRFRRADDTGMKVPMATTNLFPESRVQGRRAHRQRPRGAEVGRHQDADSSTWVSVSAPRST